MNLYHATNYSMGRPIAVATFTAASHESACRIAEQKLPGKNGIGFKGMRATIIGVKLLEAAV